MKNYIRLLTLSIFLVIALAGYVSAAYPDEVRQYPNPIPV